MPTKLNFKEVIKNKKAINIVIHDFPDPDAISSAIGMTYILKHAGATVGNIYYTGEISHPQNKAMLTLLNLSLVNYETDPFKKGSSIVLVDTNNVGQDSNQQKIRPDCVNVLAIIDHHKGHASTSPNDIRAVGACASIVWQYLKDMNYNYSTDEGILLATSLVTGIFTDTNSLMSDNITQLDFDAYQDLIKRVDKQKLSNIMNYPLPLYLFELRQQAFQDSNKNVVDSTIISGVGKISPSKRDALPIIADEFLRMTGITTSIVFAIIDDYIDVSVRSNDITLDVGSFVHQVFGTGGGKQGAGRAKIHLGFFTPDANKEINNETWNLVKNIVHSKVHDSIKGQ